MHDFFEEISTPSRPKELHLVYFKATGHRWLLKKLRSASQDVGDQLRGNPMA